MPIADANTITGNDLKLARILYGFESQEALAKELDSSLGTVQRYESLPEVDAKVRGVYEIQLGFDLYDVIHSVTRLRTNRKVKVGK